VQSLLTARVDRLAPKDRALLQAASVIGRQFDPELLGIAVREAEQAGKVAMLPFKAHPLRHACDFESEGGEFESLRAHSQKATT
jgi:hypothetical protein